MVSEGSISTQKQSKQYLRYLDYNLVAKQSKLYNMLRLENQ